MPRSNRSLVSTVCSLMAATLSLSLAMLMGYGGGAGSRIRQRDIHRVLRSVSTLVQGLLHSSEDAGRSGSESDQESDSHDDDAGNDGDDRRHGRHHHRHTHHDDDYGSVSSRHLRASASREPPIHIEDDEPPMLAIHDGVQDLDANDPDHPGRSGSAPSSPARMCMHLRPCRRGSNMHMMRVTCRDCGRFLRAVPKPMWCNAGDWNVANPPDSRVALLCLADHYAHRSRE